MESERNFRRYSPAKRGNVKPYLFMVALKKRLMEWLQTIAHSDVESITGLDPMLAWDAAEHLILTLTTRELRRAKNLLEEQGENAVILLIHQLKSEEI